MAEVKKLRGQMAGLGTSIGNRMVDGQMAQPVLDAVAAWCEAQLHTPIDPRLKARKALIEAARHYAAYVEAKAAP